MNGTSGIGACQRLAASTPNGQKVPKAVIVNGLIKIENTLPVVLHANDRPAILLGFVV
jgi:hypothetical protein